MSSNRFPSGPEVMLKSFSDILSYTLSKAINNNSKTKYRINEHIVYHYTSSRNLPLILNENNIKIRFTDYRFLNDTTEGEELPHFFTSKLEDLHNRNRISQDFFEKMCNRSQNNNLPNIFVACFSRDKDSLPMWNYYLKDGKYEGYSLGFKFSSQVLADPFTSFKVIYNDKEKEKFIEEMILSSYDNKNQSISDNCEELTKTLQQFSLFMKKSCFSHEKEVRLLFDYNKAKQDPLFSDIKIQYNNKNGIMQPYCDVIFHDTSIFKSCCFAPTMQTNLTTLGLTSFLKSREYDLNKLDIINSEIPVRY